MVSVKTTGTLTTTDTSENTLATITDAGSYQLQIDTSDMVNGDIVVVRAKLKVGSGGTTRTVLEHVMTNIQSTPVMVSDEFHTGREIIFTLQQQIGTASFPWDVLQTNTEISTVETKIDTIDTVVDAIKAKTDQLTFTIANQVDANAESMNAAEILGNGTSANKWRGE